VLPIPAGDGISTKNLPVKIINDYWATSSSFDFAILFMLNSLKGGA